MYKALDIARYVINFCNAKNLSISNLRLQKLLYFIQANFILHNHKPCFDDTIECWKYGPVVPNVYSTFRTYGSDSIPTIEKILIFNFSKSKIEWETFNFEFDNELDKALVEDVIMQAKNKTTSELINISHNQSPWRDNYKEGYKRELPIEDMYKYFFQ